VHTDLVVFVDSDCIVPEGWLDVLIGHFSDPLAAGVAPRIVNATRLLTLDVMTHHRAAHHRAELGP
jgi:hypothetical protein